MLKVKADAFCLVRKQIESIRPWVVPPWLAFGIFTGLLNFIAKRCCQATFHVQTSSRAFALSQAKDFKYRPYLLYIYCIFMFVCVFFCASSSSMSISYTENIVRRRFGFCLLSHRFTLLTSEISFQHCRSRLKKRQFDCLKYSIGFDSLSCTCSQCQPQKNKQPQQARTGRCSWYVVHTKRESDRSVQSAYKLILQCPHGSLSYVSKCNEGIDSKRGCATPSEGFLVGIVQCKCNGKMSYSE